jgi:8-oxo-dGTP pyrophosphatase MutT (NUDIX family)
MTEKSQNQNQTKKEFSAGLIVYRNTPQGPRFLLLYHGGRYWNFPKGHIENLKNVTTSIGGDTEEINVRETSKEAAIRETREETGIDPSKLSIKRNFRAVEKFRFRRNREQIFKVVIFYLAETDEVEVKISSEHEGFGWFQYKDARHILAPYKDSQRLLRNAYEYIRPKPVSRPRPISSKPQGDSRQSQPKPSDQA